MKAKRLWQVFLSFLKIGAFTFGGGYAMIPLIQSEAAEKRGWVSDEDILEIVAIAESTPGPIAINAATFVGYRACGVPGAIAATLGVVLPSYGIILLISLALREFRSVPAVQFAFRGIRVGVLALLFKALYSMYKKSPKGACAYIVMAGSFLLTAVLSVNVLFVIVGCAVFGLLCTLYREGRK